MNLIIFNLKCFFKFNFFFSKEKKTEYSNNVVNFFNQFYIFKYTTFLKKYFFLFLIIEYIFFKKLKITFINALCNKLMYKR